MQGACTVQALLSPEGVLAFIGAVGAIVAALTALAIQVARNARDIQAAWGLLRDHGKVLNVVAMPPEKDGET